MSAQPVIVNAMSIDVEDYFHVTAFEATVSRREWSTYESRVTANTDRLLDQFARAGIHATFFVLGWVAERYPALVRRIAIAGHEVASHGYAHRLVYEQTPAEFREDVRRARAVIESVAARPVSGYRAPSWSITPRSLWALPILVEEGYAYDSSIFPIHHDRYGMPGAPRRAHTLQTANGPLREIPPATITVGRVNLPIAGGGYFRLLPYRWTRWGIDRLNRVERQPAVFYLHPWETDAGQPRLPASLPSRIRHYHNLSTTATKLSRLLRDFRFDSIAAVYGVQAPGAAVAS